MSMSSDELKSLASLACITIEDTSITKLNDQMNSILDFVEQLQKTDTHETLPLFHPLTLETRTRPDEVTEADCLAQLEAIANQFEDGMYLVPQVIDAGN